MNPNPLTFYPNEDFHGLDELLTCKLITKIEDLNWMSHKSKKRSEHNLSFFSESDTKFYKRKREISYYADDEKLPAKQVAVFDTIDNIKFHKEPKAFLREVHVKTSSCWKSIYIIIINKVL